MAFWNIGPTIFYLHTTYGRNVTELSLYFKHIHIFLQFIFETVTHAHTHTWNVSHTSKLYIKGKYYSHVLNLLGWTIVEKEKEQERDEG